jgi:uncharacterized membrane protein YhaH (DUF805 family)
MDGDADRTEEYRKWKEGDTRSSEERETYTEQTIQHNASGGRPAHIMSFTDAVTNVLINNYVGFKGRASRSEYWWFFLFISIVGFITGLIDGFVFGIEYSDPMWFSNLAIIALFLPNLSVYVRRLHDLGYSGWLILIGLIPFLGVIILLIFAVMEGEEHPNQYGAVPTNTLEQDGNIHTNY